MPSAETATTRQTPRTRRACRPRASRRWRAALPPPALPHRRQPEAPRWLLDGMTLFLQLGTLRAERIRHRHRRHPRRPPLPRVRARPVHRVPGDGARTSRSAPSSYYGRVSGPVDNFTYWLFGFQLGVLPARPVRAARRSGCWSPAGWRRRCPSRAGGRRRCACSTGTRRTRRRARSRSAATARQTARRLEGRAGRDGGRRRRRPRACRSARTCCCARSCSCTSSDSSRVPRRRRGVHPQGPQAGRPRRDRGRPRRNDKWSALIGVDLDLAKLLDTESPLAKGLGTLTGTIFAGNKPGMFAIGQLADQSSWLTLVVQQVAARPAGAGLVRRSACRSARSPGRGASASSPRRGRGQPRRRQGAVLRLVRAAHRHVGQRGELVRRDRLGRGRAADQGLLRLLLRRQREGDHRAARPAGAELQRASLEVRIETPWWLPDVTFRVVKVSGTAAPEQCRCCRRRWPTAAAIEPGKLTAVGLAVTAIGEPGAVHTIDALRAAPDGRSARTRSRRWCR